MHIKEEICWDLLHLKAVNPQAQPGKMEQMNSQQ